MEVVRATAHHERLCLEQSLARQVRVEYDIPLNDFGDVIRVRFVREGKLVVDHVAQYEALIDGAYRPVVRYDGSHGQPHRDILDWTGATIEKRWAPVGTTTNLALTEGIHDIVLNWPGYLDDFLRRRP